jgi:hypothetical protein
VTHSPLSFLSCFSLSSTTSCISYF